MSNRKQTHEGDVFSVELEKGRYAFGQVVSFNRSDWAFVGFGYTSARPDEDAKTVVQHPIVFFLNAVDTEIVDGRWKVIGNAAPPVGMKFPEYKVYTPEGYKVTSHKGEILRDATVEEKKSLGNMKSYNPTMLETALKARNGLAEWKPWMDELLYCNIKGTVNHAETFTAQGAGQANKRELERQTSVEQAVVVHFNYGSTDLVPLKKVEKEIEQALERAGVGDYDGDEVATDGRDGYLYMYGPDADKVFKVVEPILKRTKFMKGARVKRRYGPPQDGVKSKITVV